MKKIILFITVITFLITSCEKNNGAKSPGQANLVQIDPNAAKYAEIVNSAVRNYFSTNKINKDDSNNQGNDNKDDSNNKGNGKLETKEFSISGSGNIAYTLGGDCGAGLLQFNSTGTAESNVLGTLDQKTSFCIDPATEQILTVPTGVAEDKDGNKLNYSLAGMGIDAATGLIYQIYIITGGTKDYKKATGSMTLLYHVFTPTNFAYTGTGTITF